MTAECQQSDWCGPGSHCLCRPAASGGATDGEREAADELVRETEALGLYDAPTPVASQADGELRARSIRLAWHDVTCPEAEDCRTRALHAASSVVADAVLPRFLDRLRALDGTGRPAGAESGSQGDSGRSTGQGGVR